MDDIAKIAAMPNDQQIIEAMARAAFERRHKGARNCYAWDDFWEENEYQRDHYMDGAQAALAAQREMGLVLVSAERLAALEELALFASARGNEAALIDAQGDKPTNP